MMMIILVDEKRPRCLADSLDSMIIPVAVSLPFTDYMGLFPQDAELLYG